MTHFLSFVVKVLDGERQYSAPERVKQVNSDSQESVLCSCTLYFTSYCRNVCQHRIHFWSKRSTLTRKRGTGAHQKGLEDSLKSFVTEYRAGSQSSCFVLGRHDDFGHGDSSFHRNYDVVLLPKNYLRGLWRYPS
jgi:hypothetical protein